MIHGTVKETHETVEETMKRAAMGNRSAVSSDS